MQLTSADAVNILANTTKDVVEQGKVLLGARWDDFTPEEKTGFIDTMTLLARAKVATLAGNPAAVEVLKTLEVTLGEWRLAGKTEVLIVAREVATTVLSILVSATAAGLKKALGF